MKTTDGKLWEYRFFKVLSVAVGLVLWEVISRSGFLKPRLFPPPSLVFTAWWGLLSSGQLVLDTLASLQRVGIGYCLASIAGIALGTLTGRSPLMDSTVGVIISLLRSIPSVAFVPLAILWFGVGESSKYFLVAWGVFFPVWINTSLGSRGIDKEFLWAAASLGASPIRLLVRVVFPAALPHIIAGMRTGIGTAFICLVAAEMAGAFSGIGYRVGLAHLAFETDQMLAAMATLGMLGAVSDRILAITANALLPWYRTMQRGQH